MAEAFRRRSEPGRALADDAERVTRACLDMAIRFRRGGKLIVFGNGGQSTDAQHIAVEFVHPVIVGKRALPAVCLTDDAAALTGIAASDGFDEVFAAQLKTLAATEDIAIGLTTSPCSSPDAAADARTNSGTDSDSGTGARDGSVLRGLEEARRLGLLTVALTGAARTPGPEHTGADGGGVEPEAATLADHVLTARSDDPCVIKEMHVTLYHLLWELVHVFFERPEAMGSGVLRDGGGGGRR